MEQVVGNVTMFAHQKYEEFIVTNYNHTEWWPAVHNLEVAIVNRTDNITAALFTSKDLLASVYGEESWWYGRNGSNYCMQISIACNSYTTCHSRAWFLF
eukprot:m.96791 g.96791  ORF g.96791 m.96791 type:complete len:99 (-) comp8974_c1_seq4:95-391(-)